MLNRSAVRRETKKGQAKTTLNGELVIRVSGDSEALSAQGFLLVLRRTIKALNSLVSENHVKRWNIVAANKVNPFDVTLRSPDIYDPRPQKFVQGVDLLVRGANYPNAFTESTVNQVSAIAHSKHRHRLRVIEYRAGGIVASADEAVATNADKVLGRIGRVHYETTTLRGNLETLSVKYGSQFFIRDHIRNRNVRCDFDPALLPNAKEALGKRIAVSGEAKYNVSNDIIAIRVSGFRILPTDLPRLSDLPPAGIAGGVDAVEFIRRLRGG